MERTGTEVIQPCFDKILILWLQVEALKKEKKQLERAENCTDINSDAELILNLGKNQIDGNAPSLIFPTYIILKICLTS